MAEQTYLKILDLANCSKIWPWVYVCLYVQYVHYYWFVKLKTYITMHAVLWLCNLH